MNDRLADLEKYSNEPIGEPNPWDDEMGQDIELGEVPEDDELPPTKGEETSTSSGNPLQDFFVEINRIRSSMENIVKQIDSLKRCYHTVLHGTNPKEMKNSKDMVSGIMNVTSAEIRNCQAALSAMNKQTKEMKKIDDEDGSNRYSAVVRVREQQYSLIAREFMQLMEDYQQVQSDYKSDYQERMKRSIRIVNSNVSDQQIQAMIDKPDLQPADVFNQDMLTASQRHTVDALYIEVTETHKDILKLEVSLRELHQLFVDFANLVDEQEEMLDNIEYNVMHAKEYVHTGVDNLKTSKKLEKRSRKVFACGSCAIVISLIVAGLVIAAALGILTPVVLKFIKP